MAITTQTPEYFYFQSLEEVVPFVNSEKEHIYRVSLSPLLTKGAALSDDKYFGLGSTRMEFSSEGLEQFCWHLKTNPAFVQQAEREGLASDILNDRLSVLNKEGLLKNSELIIDGRENQIIGVVSNRYCGFSNLSLLETVSVALSDKQVRQKSFLHLDFGKFELKEAYSYNSRLFLRLISTHKTGIIKGKGGEGEDITYTGLQLSNSMAGGHALKLSYYLYRLICANGLVVPTGSQADRVVHIGTAKSFSHRLEKAVSNIVGTLKTTHSMIKRLYGIEFVSLQAVKAGITDDICNLISGRDLRKEFEDMAKLKDWEKEGMTTDEIKQDEDQLLIEKVMKHLGGKGGKGGKVIHSFWRDNASMFDIINIFTEIANSLPYREMLETQENAGRLADFIDKNRKKFA
ncbi:hypothetical protein [Spongorhabdus nitratireducens]